MEFPSRETIKAALKDKIIIDPGLTVYVCTKSEEWSTGPFSVAMTMEGAKEAWLRLKPGVSFDDGAAPIGVYDGSNEVGSICAYHVDP